MENAEMKSRLKAVRWSSVEMVAIGELIARLERIYRRCRRLGAVEQDARPLDHALLSLRQEIEALQMQRESLEQGRRRMKEQISAIPDPGEKYVVYTRYIENRDWNEISGELQVSRTYARRLMDRGIRTMCSQWQENP